MKVVQERINDVFGGYTVKLNHQEVDIVVRGLRLYLDYNPRKAKDKPSYTDKKMTVEMIEALRHPEMHERSE